MISHSKRCKKKEDSRSLVLTAAALQDHLTKTHHISLSLGRNNGTGSGVTGKCSNCGGSKYSGSKERPLAPISTKRGKTRNVVDCWLMKSSKDSAHEEKPKFGWEKWERECVLDPKPPPLTLAERLGLVHQPAPLLVEEEWQDIKKKSNQRDDSNQPCPICRDVFGIKQQVILSCSHVFHRSCLQAFERHSGKKCCPLCRQEKYQTRIIFEGARKCRTQAAIRIQACWRGYVVRCWYRKVRQSLPPKDPNLRKKFFERKLSEIAERILGMSSRGERVLDSFLASVDRNIEDSRNVMRSYEQERLAGITEEEWRTIRKKACELQMSSCAICLAELAWQPATAIASTKSTALLSCSHIFHLSCIESLEQFSLSEHRVCPICRSFYARIEL